MWKRPLKQFYLWEQWLTAIQSLQLNGNIGIGLKSPEQSSIHFTTQPSQRNATLIFKTATKCEAGGGASEELIECPPPSPAVLWFVNVREWKTQIKKEVPINVPETFNSKTNKYK